MTTWAIIRAAGIGVYLMVFLSVAWGLVATTTLFGKRVSRASATTVHQYLSTTGLVLLAVHVVALLVDAFMPFGLADVTIPLASAYRPFAVALGVIAMYVLVAIIVLSWLRKRVGTTWWRRSHLLAIPVFAMSLAHGLLAGTDTQRPAMWWMYLGTAIAVVFLVLVRGFTVGFRPPRAAPPEGVRVRTPRPAEPHEPTAPREPIPTREPETVTM